jgi:cytochrome c5
VHVRNPANAPDAADRAALDQIKDQLEQGEPVAKVIVQKVTRPGQPAEWRVYRPLVVIKQCLVCHGESATLAPGVLDALKVFYPHDTAVDYKEGDWRGLLRVTIVVPAAAK